MKQEEGAQDKSKPGEQASSMNGNSGSVPAGRGSDPTSPSPSPSEGRHAEAEETIAAFNVSKMGSTDSAGNARGSSSCGLVSSLLPSSCRGSAEAFARCLHRRLTSLSGENGSPERTADAAVLRETSWLHPSSSSSNRHSITANNLIAANQHSILQHQPRHSSESDLFYELDEEDGPDSPAEEATAAELAHLLVNPETLKTNHHYYDTCHCSPSGTRMAPGFLGVHSEDSESGCLFASPIAGTPPNNDSPEMFFDPESSDAEKSKNEVFFDPVSTSDSEINNSNLTNVNFVHARNKIALNGHVRRTNTNMERNEDTTSESSCSSRRNSASCVNGRRQEEQVVCSSEDSLNGRSSQETTSPSHESLWSTFDDSTVSLQDESPPRIIQNTVVSHICLPKSHSDSELPSNVINMAMSNKLKIDRWNEEVEKEKEDEDKNDEDDFVNNISKNVMCNDKNGSELDDFLNDDKVSVDKVKNRENCTEFPDDTNMPSKNTALLKVDTTIVNDSDTDQSYSSAVDIPETLTLECSSSDEMTTQKSELKLRIKNDDMLHDDGEEEKLNLLLKKLGDNSIEKDKNSSSSSEQETQSEIVEEEEDRPQRVRRCSSLKTGKTPPGTPHRKKIVRFADKLGLDLADVRTFLDEIPKIPNSAYNDLIYDDIFRSQQDNGSSDNVAGTSNDHWYDHYQDDAGRRRSMSAIPKKLDRMLVPLFQQPGGMTNFLDIMRERRVCLENVLIQDPVTLAIQGTVRVLNLDFHKSVHIRYTLNCWRNFSDLQATYVPNSCDGFSDKFTFVLYCHTLLVGQRLEFAVRFQCKGIQYWDNNAGANYCFQCLPATSSTGYIPITADENRRGSWSSSMFY